MIPGVYAQTDSPAAPRGAATVPSDGPQVRQGGQPRSKSVGSLSDTNTLPLDSDQLFWCCVVDNCQTTVGTVNCCALLTSPCNYPVAVNQFCTVMINGPTPQVVDSAWARVRQGSRQAVQGQDVSRSCRGQPCSRVVPSLWLVFSCGMFLHHVSACLSAGVSATGRLHPSLPNAPWQDDC